MSATEEVKDSEPVDGNTSEEYEKPMPSVQDEVSVILLRSYAYRSTLV
ncbi:hypothetical protein SAY86_002547 [Trapa natans]|uniref:Uncharacterized protein n=1 Tax=Trapa natans TaxID=22666 RepID=A0AAN7LQG8_TRANT|nr:hypothetical protein SAY86_002547 [Trapa natans]